MRNVLRWRIGFRARARLVSLRLRAINVVCGFRLLVYLSLSLSAFEFNFIGADNK